MGQPDTYAVTPRQPMTRAQKNGDKLFAALVGGPVPLLIGILARPCMPGRRSAWAATRPCCSPST